MKLSDLTEGQAGWCRPDALCQDLDGILWIAEDSDCQHFLDEAYALRVGKSSEGFDVDRSHCRDHAVKVIDRPGPGLIAAYDHTRPPFEDVARGVEGMAERWERLGDEAKGGES